MNSVIDLSWDYGWAAFWLIFIGQFLWHVVRSYASPRGVVRFSSPLVIASLPLTGDIGSLLALLLGQCLGSVFRAKPVLQWNYIAVDTLAVLVAGWAEKQVLSGKRFVPDIDANNFVYNYMGIGVAIAVYLGLRIFAYRMQWIHHVGKGASDLAIFVAPAMSIAFIVSPLSAYWVLFGLLVWQGLEGMQRQMRHTRDQLQHEKQRMWQARVVASAQDGERARLARDLHDGPLQEIIAARRLIEAGLPERAVTVLADAVSHLRASIYDMHPSVLQLGLATALKSIPTGSGIQVHYEFSQAMPNLPEDMQLAVYRIASEALNNTIKHSQATQVWLRLGAQAHSVVLEIQDNGTGLRLKPSSERGGLGMVSMRERTEALGGVFSASSNATGTLVRAEFPVRSGS